jgi:hypothetical protein
MARLLHAHRFTFVNAGMGRSTQSDPTDGAAAARYYRGKARFMREVAARTKFADTRAQLLWIAAKYDRLAEHAETIDSHEPESDELRAVLKPHHRD